MALEYGTEVKVRPTAAHCPKGAERSMVIADPTTGRFLPVKGETVRWSTHHAERLRHGEIEIVVEAHPALPAPTTNKAEVK